MRKKNDLNFVLPLIICFIPFILSAVFYNQLPENVAIHFNNAGEPDNYAPRLFAAFGIPFLMLCVFLFSTFVSVNSPKYKNTPVQLRHLFRWLVPVISLFTQAGLISYSVNNLMVDWLFYTSLLLSVFFIVIGNYLPKCRQNYIIGYKLPWTLHDIDNWNKTHRLAGYLWIAGGVVMIANTFLRLGIIIPFITLTLVLVPFVYSYIIYIKKN